jgi:hypothetical protein
MRFRVPDAKVAAAHDQEPESADPPVPASPPLVPTTPAHPEDACPVCGERQYWRAITGPFRCYRCDPPPQPDDVSVEGWWYVAP